MESESRPNNGLAAVFAELKAVYCQGHRVAQVDLFREVLFWGCHEHHQPGGFLTSLEDRLPNEAVEAALEEVCAAKRNGPY
jgi:hypothetical protein